MLEKAVEDNIHGLQAFTIRQLDPKITIKSDVAKSGSDLVHANR